MNNIQTSLRNLRATVEEIKRRPRPTRGPGQFVTVPIREGSKLLRRVWAREVSVPAYVNGEMIVLQRAQVFSA